MKIATYNVWNENKGIGNRVDQLIDEITKVNADIIGLQEVTTHFFNNVLKIRTDYKDCKFRKYDDEDEGLAILSRYPLEECFFLNSCVEYDYSRGLNVKFQVGQSKFSLMNVHLPSDSAKLQEKQIFAIDRYISIQKEQADYIIMIGDFNGGIESSVHRYLVGEQTINGDEPCSPWDEMSSSYAVLNGLPLNPTLDCINNPRWKGKNSFYIPSVMDRINIMDSWIDKTLHSVENFGTDVSPVNNLCASDHYGVLAEVSFIK